MKIESHGREFRRHSRQSTELAGGVCQCCRDDVHYGEEHGTAVIGIFNVGVGIVALVIPPIGTAVISATGTYRGGVLLSLGMSVIALFTVATSSRFRAG